MRKILSLIVFSALAFFIPVGKVEAACTLSTSGAAIAKQPVTVRVVANDWSSGIIHEFSSKPSCSFSPSNCKADCSVQMTCQNAGTYTVTADPRGLFTGSNCSTTITVRTASNAQEVNCREACIPGVTSTRTAAECSRLPSCNTASSNPTTKEQCQAAGNSPSECASLPSYQDTTALKAKYEDAVTASGGNVGLPEGREEVDLGFIKLSTNPAILAGQLLDFGMGLAALFAILLTSIGGYQVATSVGNPDQLEEGKKRITAAIAGLVFILASVLILNTIGCGLIGIGGEGKSIICQ